MLVNHARRLVEVFRRGAGARWEYIPFGEHDAVDLATLDVKLEVAELYTDPNE